MSTAIVSLDVRLKRVYEPNGSGDGCRVLIDRLWPRGVKKADAAIDLWSKEISPSSELRKWFDHDPARWREFRRRYMKELSQHHDQLEQLRALARKGPITLVYAARDRLRNDAVVLREVLLDEETRS